MSSSSGKIKSDTNLYLNGSIDLLFNFYRNKFNVKTDQYMIYGHSGGAQFVHWRGGPVHRQPRPCGRLGVWRSDGPRRGKPRGSR